MCIKVPLFIDKNTETNITEIDPYPGFIYMDAMAFGMGSTCIQSNLILIIDSDFNIPFFS